MKKNKMSLSLEQFTALVKEINSLLVVDLPGADEYFIKMFEEEPPKPEYCPSKFFRPCDDLVKNLNELKDKLNFLYGQKHILLENMRQCNNVADRIQIEERMEKNNDDIRLAFETYNEEERIFEEAKLKRYDDYYNEELIPDYERKLKKWKEEKSMWFPLFPTEKHFEEFYEEYCEDPKSVIDKIINKYHYSWMPFKRTFFIDKTYIQSLVKSNNCAECIFEFLTIKQNTKHTRNDILLKYDFSLEELLEITKIIINPPYPIQNSQHEDEYETDPSQQFDLISNENLRYMIEISKRNYETRHNKESTEITFILPNSIILEKIDRNTLNVFGIFAETIKVSSFGVYEKIVKFLYTGKIDRDISNEEAEELELLFMEWNLNSYAALCSLIPFIRKREQISFNSVLKDFSGNYRDNNDDEDDDENDDDEEDENDENV